MLWTQEVVIYNSAKVIYLTTLEFVQRPGDVHEYIMQVYTLVPLFAWTNKSNCIIKTTKQVIHCNIVLLNCMYE